MIIITFSTSSYGWMIATLAANKNSLKRKQKTTCHLLSSHSYFLNSFQIPTGFAFACFACSCVNSKEFEVVVVVVVFHVP
jgi:hypothetical protein